MRYSESLLNHAFYLAENLLQAGAPRQVDLRRAVSAAYYAVFHELCNLIADQLIGVTKSASEDYRRCYRTLPHNKIPESGKLYDKAGGASSSVTAFCNMATTLQTERHLADYDPHYRATKQKVLLLLSGAKTEMASIRRVSPNEKLRLATALVFPVR